MGKCTSINNHHHDKSCCYSKAMNQPYPRKCIYCGQPEERAEQPKPVFEQPKPQYFVRNLSTGKFVKKYSGGNSWSSLGLAMNRLRQVSHGGNGFQIEKYGYGAPEIINPATVLEDAKVLEMAKRMWEEDRKYNISKAAKDIRDFTGLDLGLDGYRKLMLGDLISGHKKAELQMKIDILLCVSQARYTDEIKTQYIQRYKNETNH